MAPLALGLFGFLFLPYVIVIGILIWGSATLLIHAWQRRKSPVDLLDPWSRYQPESVGDEAERWLKTQF